MHVIDEASPLFGVSPEQLEVIDALFILTVTGQDETSGQVVTARETYTSDDLRWGIASPTSCRRARTAPRSSDYAKFHDVEPVET